MLPLGGVELVDDGADADGEVLDAVAEPVAAGEVGALGGEAGALVIEFALACGDRGGAALQFGHVDQPGLVEVDEPAVLAAGGLEFAVQAGQFGGEQLVVGDGSVHRDGLLAGQQQAGVEHGGAYLAEDELIESVGADVALGAAPVLASGAQRVVVVAVVVPVPGAVAAAHLWQLVPTPQGPHLTSPRSSQAPGSARRGLHLVLSVLTLPAASNASSAMMAGQLIAIQSARGRGTWREWWPGRRSGTASVRLK